MCGGRVSRRYQNAPGGARSKPSCRTARTAIHDTRMLRGERDQNGQSKVGSRRGRIPECSGGSEIKTGCARRTMSRARYQNAPGGARSKQKPFVTDDCALDTRMLRGERDQNQYRSHTMSTSTIPECSGGSEIKTGDVDSDGSDWGYQNAPGGARSKLDPLLRPTQLQDTRMLRGERDQNGGPAISAVHAGIPECSGGSEIKTSLPLRQKDLQGYQNAYAYCTTC